MKRTAFLLTALALLLAAEASAREGAPRPRKKYLNLSYSMPSLSVENSPKVKSDYGFAFTTGRSYYLHRKPIVGLIRFGIDATWLDLSYGNYSADMGVNLDPVTGGAISALYFDKIHQAEIGMQVGPSVTVTPFRNLAIHVYFRYAPTFAMLFNTYDTGNDESYLDISGGYASFFVAGGSVSWGAIGLGAEARWGSGKYKVFRAGLDDEYGIESSKSRIKTSGWRVYLNFRF